MADGWPGGALLAGFALASLVLAATPGPGVLYIVTRTLSQGRRAGLASVAGVGLGNLGNAWAAALGLAAVLAVSSLAFDVLRYAGAAYLLWLGYRAWRPADGAALTSMEAAGAASHAVQREAAHATPPSAATLFRDGALVALLNPKTALFFAAFLPQFINPAGSVMAQSLGLGALFVVIALVSDSAYVLAASVLASRWARQGVASGGTLVRLGRAASALVYISLGLLAAWSGSRAPD
jgi:threonine/homoserine/homoserine lactone efflux protein